MEAVELRRRLRTSYFLRHLLKLMPSADLFVCLCAYVGRRRAALAPSRRQTCSSASPRSCSARSPSKRLRFSLSPNATVHSSVTNFGHRRLGSPEIESSCWGTSSTSVSCSSSQDDSVAVMLWRKLHKRSFAFTYIPALLYLIRIISSRLFSSVYIDIPYSVVCLYSGSSLFVFEWMIGKVGTVQHMYI